VNKLIQKNYEYVHGSAAKQLEYDVYEENKVLKAKRRYKNNRKIKLKMVAAIIAVLAAGLVVMCRYAIITKLNYDVNRLQKNYEKIRNENSLLKVQIESKTDLNEVKEAAETRLGMQMPDKSQIIYIKVPRNDYTVVMNQQTQAENGESLAGALVEKVSGLIKLFE
jgi:cell division protein FtsL